MKVKKKNNTQIFTPKYIVNMILDELQYTGESIVNKTILEPSFGDGNFLIVISERLIKECKKKGMDLDKIGEVLNRNIYGIEIDGDLFAETKLRLNKLLNKHGIESIAWDNLVCQNTLTYDLKSDFDYIAGNPPFLRVHNMNSIEREKIKQFQFGTGTTDIYILFFEKALSLLTVGGKIGYISPNSYLKNASQDKFRRYLIENNLIETIINFNSTLIFEGILTYTAITVLNNNKKDYIFTYSEQSTNKKITKSNLSMLDYQNNPKLVFDNKKNIDIITKINKREKKLEDYCTIQYGIATNRDNIYIGKVEPLNNIFSLFNGEYIESSILRPAVKGSTYNGTTDKAVIFPYLFDKETDNYKLIDEKELKLRKPIAYSYLKKNRDELEKRDMEKDSIWYQYGRSQGINNSNSKKLTFKHMFSDEQKQFKLFELDAKTIVYSGIYIVVNENRNTEIIKEILESEEFCFYCKILGKDMQGNYKSINTKTIKSYGIKSKYVQKMKAND